MKLYAMREMESIALRIKDQEDEVVMMREVRPVCVEQHPSAA